MKTYLFDFDGTLVDSMPSYIGVMLRILDEHEIKYEKDIIKIITPLGYQGTANYFRELGIDEPVNELVLRMQRYAQNEYENKIEAKEGVIETLLELKRIGANLNVLTASPHSMLDPCLKRLGIWELFDNIWSCDDFGTTKSEPKIYREVAKKIGQRVGEIIFVDDNINAVKTAKIAGMKSYGIYDESSRDFIDEMKKEADYYIENFKDLIKYYK